MIFPVHLRCEYKENPFGIDVPKPRLSWLLNTKDRSIRNQIQSAYQIRVATEKDFLEDKPDLWDSGRIQSRRTYQIEYDGKPPESRAICWWTVRIWDGNGIVSEWSEPARWTMGLLSPDEWNAKWIGYDEWEKKFDENVKYKFTAGEDKWIWFPDGDNRIGDFYFRCAFTIAAIDELIEAPFLITADETFVLYLNGIEIDRSDTRIFSWTRPRMPDVKRYLREGNNVIGVHARNTYLDKPGLTGKLYLQFADGSHRILRTDKGWKVSNHFEEKWSTNEYNDREWQNAHRVAVMGDKPWRIPAYNLKLPPARYLRKTFRLKNKIKQVFAYASAKGLYELRLNGHKISNDKLTPGWSDYNKRIYYNTYDVTGYILKGLNGIGIILADGWYSGYIGWERRREYYGKHPRGLVQLEVEYEDGSRETITTDSTWKAAYGPIREADLLMGETYDARLEKNITGWDTGNFDDEKWGHVDVSENSTSKLQAYPANPVECVKEIQAKKMQEPAPGVYIFDLGQNFAGHVRLKINQPEGTRIVIRHGEELNEDGSLYTDNLRMARATDVYIARENAEEIWEPRFTYHGFRYVELTGCPRPPASDAVTGCVIHSVMDETGTFISSNTLINRIYENIKWSQRSNFIDIHTDCPQRDERLGWTDLHLFFPVASYNMDVASFNTKRIIELNDAQEDDGAYPPIAPKPDLGVGPLYPGAPAWADSGIILPYYMYKRYGDVRILQQYYHNMVRYIEYLCRNSDQYIRPDYGYGDWLSINADTPRPLIGTAYFARVCEFMSEIAGVLHKHDDSAKYSRLHRNIKKAFNKHFVSGDGRISGDTQTGYVLAIHFGLLDEESERKAFRYLVSDIESRGTHLSTGFLGATHVFQVLTKGGRSDIAYRLLTSETYPSWGYMIKLGATTIWERWDSRTEENGFCDPLMNSFNHVTLGAFGSWLYEMMAGIVLSDSSDVDFIFKPAMLNEIEKCSASFQSVKGKVIVDWRIREQKIELYLQIPPNTKANVNLPSGFSLLVNEADITDIERTEVNDVKVYSLVSGNYTFLVSRNKNI